MLLPLRRASFVGIGLALLAGACTGLIGVQDIYYSEEAGAGGGEGGSGDGSSGDNDGRVTTSDGGADVVVTCAADLKIDKKNCGACGHDCSNGICADGLCMLADELDSPSSIAVHGGNVYMGLIGGDGMIASCPTTGCDSTSVGVKNLFGDAGTPYPWHVVANDAYVYSSDYSGSNHGGVWRVNVAGGGVQKFPTANLATSYGAAIDTSAVYWVTTGEPGSIQWCALPGCAVATTAAPATDGELVTVAADGHIVWTENQGGEIRFCTSKASCTSAELVPKSTFQGIVEDITADGTMIYWGTNFGELFSCPTTGCANPTRILKEVPDAIVSALTVSGTHLYWATEPFNADGNTVDDTKGSIRSCTLPTCADKKTLATGQHDPDAMGLDAKSVYWANSGKRGFSDGIGTLMKAPR